MRSKLTPTFTSGKVKMMFNTILAISDLMISQLQNSPNLDMIEMKNVLGDFTTASLFLLTITFHYLTFDD
jgi:cytochrome P450 family 6